MTASILVPRARRASQRGVHGLKRLARSPRALVGLGLFGFVVLLAIVGLFWTPYPPNSLGISTVDLSPSWAHLAGTDELGRDIFSRIMVGAKTSLLISSAAALSAFVAGSTIGFVTGYIGGVLDLVVTRVMDMLLAIPVLALALGLVAFLGPSGLSVAIALGAGYTPTFTRVVRSSVVAIRGQPYVEAARGLGTPIAKVMLQDVVPNALPIIVIQFTTSLAWAIRDEAALGFLGLGVQPPQASWGSLLTEGREYLFQEPWLPIAAGLAIVIAILGINLLGDGLRDIFDPREAGRS